MHLNTSVFCVAEYTALIINEISYSICYYNHYVVFISLVFSTLLFYKDKNNLFSELTSSYILDYTKTLDILFPQSLQTILFLYNLYLRSNVIYYNISIFLFIYSCIENWIEFDVSYSLESILEFKPCSFITYLFIIIIKIFLIMLYKYN